MASICWSSVSLLILLAFPFSATLISPLLGLLALPYFLAMASDLRYCGYKRLDVLRIYGFNLVLLPVNLAGTMSSVVQGITASKAAFARTPKVRNRTVVPPFFVIAPYLLIALAGATFYFAYRHDRVENMAYAALNVVLACYAAKSFIGLRNSVVDGCIHATSLLYKQGPRRRRRLRRHADQQAAPQADWRSVLEVGFEEPDQRTAGRRRTGPPSRTVAAAPRAGRGRRRDASSRCCGSWSRSCVLAGAAYGGYTAVQTRVITAATVTRQTWFAPYVDVTLTPTYQFQSASADAARQTVLGFVVAAPGAGCTPELGRGLHAGPGRSVAGHELTHRPGAAGRGPAHRLVRRPGPHQPRRGLHQRAPA